MKPCTVGVTEPTASRKALPGGAGFRHPQDTAALKTWLWQSTTIPDMSVIPSSVVGSGVDPVLAQPVGPDQVAQLVVERGRP